MSKKSSKKKVRLFSRIVYILAFIVLCVFLFFIKRMGVLPNKYFLLIAGVLGFLEAIFALIVISKKMKKWILILFSVFAILFMIGEIYGSVKLYQTYKFLDEDMKTKETKDVYYVVVNSNSKYDSIESISGKFVYYFNDMDDFEKVNTMFHQKSDAILTEVESYSDLTDDLLTNKDKIVLLSESSYDLLLEEENGETIENSLRKLDSFEVIREIEIEENDDDISKKPFIIYLSGIDTRSGKMPSRSLSDVNMTIVVNPQTRKILLINTPRDFYVQIHGTSGLKDKLTHAGMRGGVKLSMATMQDLLGIKYDYYVRVNFNSVLRLVDAIGGVTIDSKDNFTYTLRHDRSCTIKPGKNSLNGSCAIAFARERYAYSSGDRHRGENQQQLIQAIVNKLSSSKTLISKYDKLLKALDGSFETSLSTKNITSLVQFQINDMRGWNFITSNLNGSGAMKETYSYPKRKLSVMIPNQKTIDKAKEKIKEVKGGN